MKHLPGLITGFLIGCAACAMLAHAPQVSPSTPTLRPPAAITVTLYPSEGRFDIDTAPVSIPADKLDLAYRLLTPEKYFGGRVSDFITPIVAEAVVTHADGKPTTVLVRTHGHNPAVVTVDGHTYFYARNDPDVHAGAYELIGLVHEVRHVQKQQGDGPPKP